MSLTKVIHHECVGAPNYLDVLPGDVLQYCLMPFLGWEDRIHVNMLTPVGDRTPPNKISKERIIAHQILICTKKLVPLAEKANCLQRSRDHYRVYGRRGGPSLTKVIEGIVTFLQALVQPQNAVLFQHNSSFRETAIEKVAEFSDPANIAKIPRIYLREKLANVIQKLTEMLAKYPFVNLINSQRYLSSTVWQNETAVLNEWWVPEKGVVGRYQGDIYTEIE
jgi:hypothetical protein